MLSDEILKFYKGLQLPRKLPEGVDFMNPYEDRTALALSSAFYKKYYGDDVPRRIIFGINPGRFGGGITGVPFTDPVKMETICGIPNHLLKKVELSADFIYRMIDTYGGPRKFYGDLFFSAVSPLGFVKDGKNLNYYDIRELQEVIEPFAVDCIQKQLKMGFLTDRCFCLGEGDNFRYLSKLNAKHNFFERLIPLPHPRFIMQYRRKRLEEYIALYVSKLKTQ
jgi:hypothetical protein